MRIALEAQANTSGSKRNTLKEMSKSSGLLRHQILSQIVPDIFFLVERQGFSEDVKPHKAAAQQSIKDIICACHFVRQELP
jgi:hypothetical protein